MRKPAIEAFADTASPAVPPSRALASAALAGLLCAAAPACESTKVDAGMQSVTHSSGGADDASTAGSGGAASTGGAATVDASGTGGTATVGEASSTGGVTGTSGISGTGGRGSDRDAESAGGTPSDAAGASTGGADGGSIVSPPRDAGRNCLMDGGPPSVTSTTIVTDMTQEKFTAECDARHGVVEIPPHCGGFNTCMGFSYWADMQELTEHTCKGMSSCVGFSCVVCPPR